MKPHKKLNLPVISDMPRRARNDVSWKDALAFIAFNLENFYDPGAYRQAKKRRSVDTVFKLL